MQEIVPHRIEKWPGVATIEMPAGAQVLSVQVYENTPYLWALTDPHQPSAEFVFHIYASYEHFNPDVRTEDYVGTFLDPTAKPIVANAYHVFKTRSTESLREREEREIKESRDQW